MNIKELARQALQKLHDAYNAIPDDVSEDFDYTHFENFSKAMDSAFDGFRSASAQTREAQMKAYAIEWAKGLPDK